MYCSSHRVPSRRRLAKSLLSHGSREERRKLRSALEECRQVARPSRTHISSTGWSLPPKRGDGVGRALATYQMAAFGGIALGSWMWGVLAEQGGAGVVIGLILVLPDLEEADSTAAPLDRAARRRRYQPRPGTMARRG
jgi:hypothetical protein